MRPRLMLFLFQTILFDTTCLHNGIVHWVVAEFCLKVRFLGGVYISAVEELRKNSMHSYRSMRQLQQSGQWPGVDKDGGGRGGAHGLQL